LRGLFLKKTYTVSVSIDVRITMISGVVYLLRIFKMFHRLRNNPVFLVGRVGVGLSSSNLDPVANIDPINICTADPGGRAV